MKGGREEGMVICPELLAPRNSQFGLRPSQFILLFFRVGVV
jgi:hypothetical protein